MKYLGLISIVILCIVCLYPLYVSANLSHFTENDISKDSMEYKRISKIKEVFLGIKSNSNAGSCGMNNIDLSSIANQDYSYADASYGYKLSVCGIVTEASCAKLAGSLCQYFITGNFTHMLCSYTPQAVWTNLTTSATGGVSVYMANGDMCGTTSAPRTVAINFVCNPNATGTPPIWIVSANGSCGYIVTFQTKYSCSSGSGGSDGGKSGLSGGTIFLILLIVLIPVYVAAGCIYKRTQKGAAGMEACPNIELWRAFVGYTKEGFVFTWTKLRSLCGKSGDTYETVK